jgi:hypothetical protein
LWVKTYRSGVGQRTADEPPKAARLVRRRESVTERGDQPTPVVAPVRWRAKPRAGSRFQDLTRIGIWKPVGPRFAELIDERVKNFDEAIVAVRELWGEARKTMPPNGLDLPYCVPFAGWSDARQSLEMHYVTTPIVNGLPDPSDPTKFDAYGPVTYYGGGPVASDAGRAFATLFSKQVQRDPASFDPRRDGMTFMLFMRLACPKMYGETLRHCVGGHVELTTVTRDSIKTEVIHEWPDRVGQFIEVPKATTGSVAPERHAQAQEAAGSGSV